MFVYVTGRPSDGHTLAGRNSNNLHSGDIEDIGRCDMEGEAQTKMYLVKYASKSNPGNGECMYYGLANDKYEAVQNAKAESDNMYLLRNNKEAPADDFKVIKTVEACKC